MSLVTCDICGKENKTTISILNAYICKNCEEQISKLNVNDVIDYEYYKSAIDTIWNNYFI